ncbi:hypothetical protein [Archaeoglobus sp.]
MVSKKLLSGILAIAILAPQIVKADPLPPGESPGMMEVQMLAAVFALNLVLNSVILAAVLKAMRLKLGAKLIPVVLALTLGGLLLDSIAIRVASGNALTLYFVSLALIAPYAAILVRLSYRIGSKKAIVAGIAIGLVSNPGILALFG